MASQYKIPTGFKEKTKIIAKTVLFSTFEEEQLQEMAEILSYRTVKEGEVIVKEGDVENISYIIISGTAEIDAHDKKGNDHLLSVLQEHDTIGFSEIYEAKYKAAKIPVTVTPATDMQLLTVENEKLHAFLLTHPRLLAEIKKRQKILSRIKFIKSSAPFIKLTPKAVRELAERVTEKTIDANVDLIHQGDKGDECYLITEGEIEILIKDKKNQQRRVNTLDKGDLLGELSLFEEHPRNATARSVTTCKLLVIKREVFLSILHADIPTSEVISFLSKHRTRPKHTDEIIVKTDENNLGEKVYILKQPVTKRYVELSEDGWFLWEMMDGHNTVNDLVLAFMKKYKCFVPEKIILLILDLANSGLVTIANYKAPRSHAPLRHKILYIMFRVLVIKVTFRKVDKFLTFIYNKGGYLIYTWPAQVVLASVVLSGIFAFIASANSAVNVASASANNMSYFLLVIPIFFTTIAFHELSHGLTTKACQRDVHGFGVGWFWIAPIAFCDTSDMWLASPRQRLLVSTAGIYNDLFFAGIASWVAFTSQSPEVILVAWLYATVCYVNSVANLNPIIEFDGYYIIQDLLHKPSLRKEALLWLPTFPKLLYQRNYAQLRKDYCYVIYWLACIAYLIIFTIVFMFYQEQIIFKMILGKTDIEIQPLYRLIAPSIIVLISFLKVRSQVKKRASQLKH